MKSIICLARILALSACTLAVGCAVFNDGLTNTLSHPSAERGFSESTAGSLNEAFVDADKANQPKDQIESGSGQETVAQVNSANPDRNVQGVGSAVIRGLSGVDDGASIKPSPSLDEPIEVANLDVDASCYSADRIGNVEPVQNGQTIQASLVSATIAEPTTSPRQPALAVENGTLSVVDETRGNKMSWLISDETKILVQGSEIKLILEGFTEQTKEMLIKVGNGFVSKTGTSLVSPKFGDNEIFTVGTSTPSPLAVTLLPGAETEIIVWIEGNIEAQIEPTTTPFRKFVVVAANQNDEPDAPIITSVSNAKYGGLQTFNDAVLKVYGDKTPYVRLEGQSGTIDELSFVLIDNAGKLQEVPEFRTLNETARSWQVELNLSERLVNESRLFVLRQRNGKHNYSQVPLKLISASDPTIPAILDDQFLVNGKAANTTSKFFLINKTDIKLSGKASGIVSSDLLIVAFSNNDQTVVVGATRGSGTDENWEIPLSGLRQGSQDFAVRLMLGDKPRRELSATIPVFVRTEGPRVVSVDPKNFGTAPGVTKLTITFDPENPIVADSGVKAAATYSIVGSNGTGVFTGNSSSKNPSSDANVVFNSVKNSVTLDFGQLPADIYQLTINGAAIEDVYGNKLEGKAGEQGTKYVKILGADGIGLGGAFTPDSSPTVRPGITSTGDYVPYPEFAKRPDVPDGFNPNDKVETRVVRLYYYRDAHRIAQIVNRKVQSYNRQAVDTNRQLADKARNQASQLSIQRQNAERNAIIQATNTRQKERELAQTENSLDGSIQQLSNYRIDKPEADPARDPTIRQLESLVNSFTNQVKNLQSEVQNLRDQEVQANELTQQAEAQEKLAREEQFRREVAAAHSDPDTYAPGVVNSIDPVEQVSVSVVGEGLIQLRGPLKGVNLIRTAIDQLDSPVGQVRISIHTIQINGERADRMEKVAKEVQTNIDHARFLTMRSSEMLRKAVVQVASRKAEEASGLYPGNSQMDRDARYIEAFFGKDFIDELRAMDSEFLHSGNKLLSLHSMDTTSLASALNLMALAKNSTRQEIFQEFESMLQSELPQAEMNYFEAGWTCPKKKSHFHRCKDCQPCFCPMAQNARFESLRGFFDMQISNDDTMTPLQREFIRLAQIFKSRLITEMELKQRVMERAIIEERLGNRKKELEEARDVEKVANAALVKAENLVVKERIVLITSTNEVYQALRSALFDTLEKTVADAGQFANLLENGTAKQAPGKLFIGQSGEVNANVLKSDDKGHFTFTDGNNQDASEQVQRAYTTLRRKIIALYDLCDTLDKMGGGEAFKTSSKDAAAWRYLGTVINERKLPETLPFTDTKTLRPSELDVIDKVYKEIQSFANPADDAPAALLINNYATVVSAKMSEILEHLSETQNLDASFVYAKWSDLKTRYFLKTIEKLLRAAEGDQTVLARLNSVAEKVNNTDAGFRDFLAVGVKLEVAQRQAKNSRRPLDHKKFLDMLIDELEEKYIELLDGTRAQVANIDNYLKRVTTALDDDFNTQFYYPAFKYIRESSTSYDVQFGQTETTTVLANNREFAKADPSATMEFDLPKRDILLVEGIDGAKAMMDDVGALANDPTFLAMAKLNSPNSGASPAAGSTGGNAVVRSVLPGLGGTTSEQFMSQNANGGQQFGSNLENLIPDPAVYKFETGTGFEIRPVIQPDGQAVVFDFNYMYSTQIREPVRADEKHLGRVKRHYIDTDVQLSNFELREVSRYSVALKAARTSRGVPLLEDAPVVGALFRPLPSDENSLQQNLIMAQATIFPTLFDLMGLRWAPVVSDLDPMKLSTDDFVVRNRHRMLENRVYDESSSHVDEFLRIPEAERRMDLYRSQETVPSVHPNGYSGPGRDIHNSQMQEGYRPEQVYPNEKYVPEQSIEGAPYRSNRRPDLEYDNNQSNAPPIPNSIREPGTGVLPAPRGK